MRLIYQPKNFIFKFWSRYPIQVLNILLKRIGKSYIKSKLIFNILFTNFLWISDLNILERRPSKVYNLLDALVFQNNIVSITVLLPSVYNGRHDCWKEKLIVEGMGLFRTKIPYQIMILRVLDSDGNKKSLNFFKPDKNYS